MEKTTNINRLSLTLNVVSIAIIGYFCFMNLAGCNNSQSGQTNQSSDLTDSPRVATSAQQSQSDQEPNCCNPCDVQSNVQYDLIDGSILQRMAADYQKTRDKQNLLCGPGSPYPCKDAGSVWFALEDLKKFICQIEHSVCNCPTGLGIRIYYARYPENLLTTFPDPNNPATSLLPAGYELMHTVFMVPTFDQSSASGTDHIDFGINNGSACPLHLYNNSIPPDSALALFPNGKNHGTLCPPICQGTAFGQ